MKVVLIKDSHESDNWLPRNTELVVLAISSLPKLGSKYLIWSELQKVPALFSADDFIVIDSSVSHIWAINIDNNGYAYIAPNSWQTAGFWEAFYDGDAVAEEVFAREFSLLMA